MKRRWRLSNYEYGTFEALAEAPIELATGLIKMPPGQKAEFDVWEIMGIGQLHLGVLTLCGPSVYYDKELSAAVEARRADPYDVVAGARK